MGVRVPLGAPIYGVKEMSKIPPGVQELAKECNLEITPELELFVYKLGSRWLGLNSPFICGAGGEQDEVGLYDSFHICPAYGADGFAIYKKASEYSAPGW